MLNFKFEQVKLEDAYLITPFLAEDDRGFFKKKFEKNIYLDNGIKFNLSEVNVSKSKKGVIRGLHFQTKYSQIKLVSVDFGKIYDVIVDLRIDSPTFGQWEGFELSDDNNKLLFVPRGFAHGFITLSDVAIVSYLCDGDYHREYDSGIIWNDKDLNIDWKLDEVGGADKITLSDKDKQLDQFKASMKKNVFWRTKNEQ